MPNPKKAKYITLRWNDVEKDAKKLADKITASKFEFDTILGIARGGLVPAMLLSDLLGKKHLLSMQACLYEDGKRRESLQVLEWPAKSIEGKQILVVDDISDTGTTLGEVEKWLNAHKFKKFKFACLHSKPKTQKKPDFFARELDGWVCYPWNKREDMQILEKR